MMKHRRLNGVILSVILMSLFWMIPATTVKAIASSSSTNPPTDCTNANLEWLKNYFHIKYDWDKNGTSVTFKASHGELRFTRIDTNFFTNSFSKDADGFYVIDGKKGVVSATSSVKLNIKDSARGNSATVNLALSKASGACDSLPDFTRKKAAGQSTATFDTGNFEIVIPYSSRDQSKFKEDNSRNYNGVCRALREGTNYHGKIDSNILKKYDSSTNARSYYSIIAPSCFDSSKTAVYVFSEAQMIKVIEKALSTWETYNTLKSNNIGTGPKDVNGDPWLIDFAKVKKAAKEAGNFYYADGTGNFYKAIDEEGNYGALVRAKGKSFSMKCKVTANSSTDFSNLLEFIEDAKGNPIYNIDANTQSYYAYDLSKQSVTYKWYSKWNSLENPKAKEVKVDNFCSKKCEETVEVKYGPPIASKAGLCFEYQVQVTSRVKCTTSMNGTPPGANPPFCVPVPYCNDIPGHTHQAGATDEYKACIKSCDGGKYTEKCSEKCYNKVYENASNKTSSNDYNDDAKKLYSTAYSFDGYHYFSGKKIHWSSDTYANYYKYFEAGRTYRDHLSHGGHYVPEAGYKKRLYDTGTCKDPCFFSGCNRHDYVNKSDFINDYLDNLEKYRVAINECKASASCTEKTATFKISADYKNSKGTIRTIDYPYTVSADELISDGKAEKCTPNQSVVDRQDSVILNYKNYLGCYKKCGNSLQYHTRWSFPGTWINKKTGQISFKVPDSTTGWKERDNKFCIPLDAQDVNVKWWKYYYGHFDATHTTSMDESSTLAYCVKLTNSSSISEDDIEKWDVDGVSRWNINASTGMFGYYGWSFDISCFYALNSKGMDVKNESSSSYERCNTPTSTDDATAYLIRPIDYPNAFPDANGTDGKRAPGFNWSKYANITSDNGKNKEYQSLPSVYAEKIQSPEYYTSLYSDQNLDYEFNLTKNVLGQLKSKVKNYSDYKGEMVTRHGMISYQSDVIRSGIFSEGSKVLKEGAIGCNNVENYSSEKCSNIHDGKGE